MALVGWPAAGWRRPRQAPRAHHSDGRSWSGYLRSRLQMALGSSTDLPAACGGACLTATFQWRGSWHCLTQASESPRLSVHCGLEACPAIAQVPELSAVVPFRCDKLALEAPSRRHPALVPGSWSDNKMRTPLCCCLLLGLKLAEQTTSERSIFSVRFARPKWCLVLLGGGSSYPTSNAPFLCLLGSEAGPYFQQIGHLLRALRSQPAASSIYSSRLTALLDSDRIGRYEISCSSPLDSRRMGPSQAVYLMAELALSSCVSRTLFDQGPEPQVCLLSA